MIRLSALSGAAYVAVGAAAVLGVAELTTRDPAPVAGQATELGSGGDQRAAAEAVLAGVGEPPVSGAETAPVVGGAAAAAPGLGGVEPDGADWAPWLRMSAQSAEPMPIDVPPVFRFAREHQGLRWERVREAFIESETSLVLFGHDDSELVADYIEGEWFLNYMEVHAPGAVVLQPGDEGYVNPRDTWFRKVD